MDANERPQSPDWIREFQAPEGFTVLSSPSTSSGNSDGGERKRTSTSRMPVANSDDPRPSPKTASKELAAGGKGVGTPKVKSRRKDADEDYVPSPKKTKRLANPSPKKVIIIDDDDVDDPKMSSKPASVPRKVPTPNKPAKRPPRSLKQSSLKNLFISGKGIEEPEDPVEAEDVVASQGDDTGIDDSIHGTQEVIGSQLDDKEDEDAAELKVEQVAAEIDVVGSQEPRMKAKVPSSLPLIFPDKLNPNKVLVECAGDDLDLSGDMGAVGRFIVCGENNDELVVDLKGVVYKAGMIPCGTLMVVNIGQSEAKVEAIMNDFMQLTVDTDRNEDETLMEGTLDDFRVGSDDEGDRIRPTPPAAGQGQENDGDPQKSKPKSKQGAQKPKKVTLKKGKVAIKVGKGGRVGKVGATRKAKATSKPSAKSKTKKQSRK